MAETMTWFAAIPVLIFGHGLNIGLATVAIFAHGVRLNMLEFSNNAGVQWAGYAYRPFSANTITTTGKEPL
jgi:V/A-type H+-transporting ATPase subunit I